MNTYLIVLHAYYPEDYSEKKNGVTHKHLKGDYLSGVMRITSCKDLDAAIQVGRELWTENEKGAVKQIRIFAYHWGTPGQILFGADTFNNLKQKQTA